ncbi:hypothetical protein CQW39_19305 [Streptomyces griseofuscus]|uniref:Uncharacterized protein n=1 Tax=Streptomyces griseofuscus TaxID=146922 RepID=A0A3R8WQZ8_9ACTN|nr:hypothetical protein [Streptomyces griseofuscus]RRQ77083.1 hypothetical protein CQW39_19305 [Streptomyces griseofuscus]RRQ83695.1 hypothetical protein CQW44_25030 [Streptomyces griseofuscus]
MFRRLYDALARPFTRSRRRDTKATDLEIAREVRNPDPYVWPLPNPYDARWRRWAKRNRAANHRLPILRDEACWRNTAPLCVPLWEAADEVVRPYVFKH